MPQVNLPNNLVDGVDTAFGSQVLGNDQAIVAVVNGGLATDNLSPSAGIKGGQLSTLFGERIPTGALADDSVTSAILDDDPAAGSPTAAVTADHIRGGAVTKEKIAAANVTLDKLKITVVTCPITFSGGANPIGSGSFTVSAHRFVSGGNYRFKINALGFDTSSGVPSVNPRIIHCQTQDIDPAAVGTPLAAIPSATVEVLSYYVDNLAFGGGGNLSGGRLVIFTIART
jgi:hypothetical protein